MSHNGPFCKEKYKGGANVMTLGTAMLATADA